MKDLLVPAIVSAVFLLLVWGSGEPYPTQDGPAHLYNSSLLLQWAGGESDAAVSRVYELRPEYTASLPGHLILGLFLRLAGTARAENVLISLYGLALIWVLSRGVGPEGPPRAIQYLSLPLAMNLCLDMGFYNFCLALPCLLRAVTWWAGGSAHAAGAAGAFLALLTAVLHPAAGMILLCTIAAVASVEALALPRRERRGALRCLPPLTPAALFLAFHLAGGPQGSIAWHDPRARLAEVLIPLALFHGSDLSLLVATATGAFLWLRVGGLLRQWRTAERHTVRLLGAAGVLLAALFLAPDEAAGGGYIGLRLNTVFFLLLLCAVGTARPPEASPPASRVAGPALALASVVVILWATGASQGRFSALMRLRAEIPEASTVLGIAAGDWLRQDADSLVPPVARPNLHAPMYVGVGRDVAVLNNYEARRDYFPVRYREGMSPFGSVLRADDDEWRFAELRPLTGSGACASDFLVWEHWARPETRQAFAGDALEGVARRYDAVAEAGAYTLFRCQAR